MRPETCQGLYLEGVCLVTDRPSCRLTCVEMARLALESGIRWIQYRDKERDRITLFRQAYKLRQLTREFGARLVVNDYADIAASVEADGVHLGQEDLPLREARRVFSGGIIGISTHSLAEALRAEAEGADYIGFGPVFSTGTKEAGSPRGLRMLKRVRETVKVPVVAIGGIGPEGLQRVFASGANAVAAASAILTGDICRNASRFAECASRYGRKAGA